MRRVISVFLGMFACLALLTAPSLAQSFDCTTSVVDELRVLDGSSAARAVEQLKSVGAEPRIRIIENYAPYGNLDLYERDFVLRCPVLQSPDGGKKNNLVTLIVEMEHRQVGLYYGPDYHGVLDSAWKSIRDQTMKPELKSGNFDNAVSKGLGAVAKAIVAYESPSSTTSVVPTPAQPSEQVRVQPSEHSTGFIWYLFGFVVLLGGSAGIVKVVATHRMRRSALRDMTQQLEAVRTAAASAVAGGVEGSDSLEMVATLIAAHLNALGNIVHASDLKKFSSSFAECKVVADKILVAYKEAEDSHALHVESSAEGIEKLVEQYKKITVRAEGLRKQYADIEHELGALQKLAHDAEAVVTKAVAAHSNAEERIEKVKQLGFHTAKAADLLTEAGKTLAEAEVARAEKAFVRMSDLCKKSTQTSERAARAAEELQELQTDILGKQQMFHSEIEKLKVLRDTALSAMERLKREYAEESWIPVSGNGSEADRLMAHVTELNESIAELVSLSAQKWDEARSSRDTIAKSLKDVQHLFEAIVQVEQSVLTSRTNAPTEIAAARTDIEKARAFLTRHDEETDDALFGDVDQAEKLLDRAEAELRKKKPNYLQVIKDAVAANQAADRVLEKATDQKETVDRKRRLAQTSASEARDAIDTATNYYRSHQSDISSSIETDLRNALSLLMEASKARTLDESIRSAQSAQRRAEEAWSRAKQDVDAAERRRKQHRDEEETRRRRTNSGSFSSSSRPRSSASSFGGGGSSSFGGGRSFGGGGSSGW